MSYPVAPKTSAAGVSAAVSGAALYILQTYVFKGNVPDGIASLVYVAVPGALAFAAAYWAPHQDRPPPGLVTGFKIGAATGNVTVLPPEERLVIPGDPEPPPGL